MWFSHAWGVAIAKSETPLARDEADAFYLSTYVQPLETRGDCVPQNSIPSSAVGYFGLGCTIGGLPGYRLWNRVDCAAAHTDMALTTVRTETLRDGEWELRLNSGRVSGELVHLSSGYRSDWEPPELTGFPAGLGTELNYPRQTTGELFSENVHGTTGAFVSLGHTGNCAKLLIPDA